MQRSLEKKSKNQLKSFVAFNWLWLRFIEKEILEIIDCEVEKVTQENWDAQVELTGQHSSAIEGAVCRRGSCLITYYFSKSGLPYHVASK
ncbi:hypothetical protein [Paenibacillus sp. HJGM_3]|uniref:hypothetical protein n=1 Tax=Paenibacillus sp. HJGM_3 TaxID=3379816 RepID=UPI00385ECC59